MNDTCDRVVAVLQSGEAGPKLIHDAVAGGGEGYSDVAYCSGRCNRRYLFSNSGILGQSWRGYAVEKLETAACAQARSHDHCPDTPLPHLLTR